jgi:sigma-B regulation protein RsbU (phosphoserine phosphatase)
VTGEVPEDSAEDLFEHAPCGYLSTLPDGTIVRVNRTFEEWTGLRREELVGARRFQDLLSPGGRIYHETHYAPLLRMQGSVREIAVEIVRADGTRLAALINSVQHVDEHGHPRRIRTTVFDATDRRRYEDELLRARRQEQETAQELSRSLLSGSLPAAPGLEVGVAYRPGVTGLEVGGDWYDAFWLDEGDTVGLVIGDVVGRGIGAAATMGQLRSAVRALASTGLPPGRLLDALDAYAARHEVGQMTTLIYAQLGLGSRRLRYACAGHPPPLVLSPGEEPSFAWDGRSTPLDVSDEPRGEAAVTLAPGSTVLLYTDGLVERRMESLTDGMDRLLGVAAAHRDDTAAALVGAVVRTLHDPAHIDDVCVLAARVAAT